MVQRLPDALKHLMTGLRLAISQATSEQGLGFCAVPTTDRQPLKIMLLLKRGKATLMCMTCRLLSKPHVLLCMLLLAVAYAAVHQVLLVASVLMNSSVTLRRTLKFCLLVGNLTGKLLH